MFFTHDKHRKLLALALLFGVAWCTLGSKAGGRASRTLAVKEAIRSGLNIDARLRLTVGSDGRAGLSATEIRDAVRAQEEPLVECLLEQTRRVGPVAGALELRVDIGRSGSVSGASIIGDGPPPLTRCVEEAVGGMRFRASENGEPSRATVRLEIDASLVGPAVESALRAAAAEQNRREAGFITLAWPVDNTKVNSKFGRRPDPMGINYQFHTGVDLRAKYGQPIKAAADGRVKYSGWRSMRGKEVVLEHGGGLETGYGHLSRILVQEGDWVSAGTPVGLAGSTGKSTFPHLHFEVSLGKKKLDPLELLGKRVNLRELQEKIAEKKRKKGRR